MTERERVERAITFGGPDRIPMWIWHLPAAMTKLGDGLRDLYKEFPSAIQNIGFGGGPRRPETVREETPEGGRYVDEWGCEWTERVPGIVGIVSRHPLDDWGKLDTYEMPDYIGWGDFDRVGQAIEDIEGEPFRLGAVGNFFERMQWVRGFENLMFDLMDRRPEVYELRDRMLEHSLRLIRAWKDYDVEGLTFADDWGSQTNLLIPPDIFREFFKPCYAAMFEEVHGQGKKVFLHSDGQIISIVEDLIEVGVNLLNAQITIMDWDEWMERFGGRLCLHCDLDRQHILPHGTPEDVRRHIADIIRTFARPEGGLVGGGEIGAEVPLENARAVFEGYGELGTVK